MKSKRLVIGVHGGLVQWVCGDATDIEVIVMDFDVEGAEEDELYNGIAAVHHEVIEPLMVLEPDVAKALAEYDEACGDDAEETTINEGADK